MGVIGETKKVFGTCRGKFRNTVRMVLAVKMVLVVKMMPVKMVPVVKRRCCERLVMFILMK